MFLAACFGSHVGHDIWRYIQDATASQRDGSNHSLVKCSLLSAVGRCLPQQKWRESQGNRYNRPEPFLIAHRQPHCQGVGGGLGRDRSPRNRPRRGLKWTRVAGLEAVDVGDIQAHSLG
jgi:hypothetical protein